MPHSKNQILSTPLQAEPGIQRDGTVFQSSRFIDGQWVRFLNGTPKKIGGVRHIWSQNSSVMDEVSDTPLEDSYVASLSVYPVDDNKIYMLCAENLEESEDTKGTIHLSFVVFQGTTEGLVATGERLFLSPDDTVTPGLMPKKGWFFSARVYRSLSPKYPYPLYVFMPICPQVLSTGIKRDPSVMSLENVPVYAAYIPSAVSNRSLSSMIGEVGKYFVLKDTNLKEFEGSDQPLILAGSGGVCVFSPENLFIMGANGSVIMNVPTADNPLQTFSVNDSSDGAYKPNEFVIANTSIVQGMSVLGSQPGGYFWSLNSVVYCQITQDDKPTFTTIMEGTTILGPNTVVNVNNTFFWIGQNCFYVVSGNVQQVQNQTNQQWFFKNLYRPTACLSFGVLNRQFDEIWWYVPIIKKNDPEPERPNHVLIYNYVTQTWYDTSIPIFSPFDPESERAICGLPDGVVSPYPLITNGKSIAEMEQGTDIVRATDQGTANLASYIVYNFSTLYAQQESMNEMWLRTRRLEVDILLPEDGQLMVYMMGMHFAQDYERDKDTFSQPFVNFEPEFKSGMGNDSYVIKQHTRYIDFSLQGRLVSVMLSVTSGDYHVGKCILNWQMGSRNSGSKEPEDLVYS